MKKNIAFFDFDGTITTRDTLFEIIKFQKGAWSFYLGFARNLPVLFFYKLGLVSNQIAKEAILKYFFAGMSVSDFQKQCDRFSDEILPHFIRPKAIDEINRLKKTGTEIVIVSASPANWICKWSKTIGAVLIATDLQVDQEKITGKIENKNCHGEEKVRRIREVFNLDEFYEILCYGDSKADKPMLSLGTSSFYKPFQN
ncbi:MAG: HAD family hydrolase [Bacteroidota bacterium]